MRIDIWSDVVCPWCWIGKHRFERGVQSLGADAPALEVHWHPFQLDPDAGTEPVPLLQAYAARFGGAERTTQMLSRTQATARAEGLPMDLDRGQVKVTTLPAHRLMWLAARNAHSDYQYVFIDEAQFLSGQQVEELAEMSDSLDIFCYGLKTDFRGEFFPGSAALLRLAEVIEEVPGGLCWCGKKATMNTRVDQEGRVIKEGEQVLIDNHTAIRYIGLCYEHWRKGISHGG